MFKHISASAPSADTFSSRSSLSSPVAARRAVVIYSGGMDSFTVLHKAIAEGYEVHALSFNYGQRHSRELEVAAKVCKGLGVSHKVVDIRAIHGLIDNSSLTNAAQDLPTGNYDEDTMTSTVVPNRNMILLSLAIGYAVNIDAEHCFYGAHGGDHAIYPDCRPEFVTAMQAVARIANYTPVEVHAPYLTSSKADILADGVSMGLDYAETWTCYLGADDACGECGSCRERLAAFEVHGLTDPLSYCTTEG